ncbi:MAG: Smr/MutS family protein [Deltaproteobacteria bacterium]|nr:Smr/MutS family protein [Deltaproteobacteria bacterium]
MIEHSLRVLEYYRLLEILSGYAASPLGRSDCLSRKPLKDLESITAEQRLVSEMKELLLVKGFVPLSGLVDLTPLLRKASKKGAHLEAKELLAILNHLRAAHRIKHHVRESKELAPSVAVVTDALPGCSRLIEKIETSITKEAEVSDAASPQLASLRSSRIALRRGIEKRLERILQGPEFTEDNVMSVREGRYVISVRAERKGSIKGIVHGYSSSHATCFMEPMAVVEENNKLVEATEREKDEERKVLRALTELVDSYSGDLAACLAIMGRVDGIYARAEFSKAIKARTPILDTKMIMHISGAMNPILLSLYVDSSKGNANGRGQAVVPIDLSMDGRKNTLIISGPNRGGKTVALKTIGLLALMCQAGMHIPVSEGTRMGVFDNILAEIGDEQDISSGRSTFSARLGNLKEIVDLATDRSLVILDELGVGTDPDEGTALAMAIMDYLSGKGALCAISTHYQRLKTYGLINKKAQNASVEFDNDTGKPTFRLLAGMPGVSHAIDIARDVGIHPEIIDTASDYLGDEHRGPESLMEELARMLEEVKGEKKAVTLARQDYERSKEGLEEERERLRRGIEQMLTEKERQADRLIGEARGEFRRAIDYLKKEGSRGQSKATQGYAEAKRALLGALTGMRGTEGSNPHGPIALGQRVFHTKSKKSGLVVGIDSGSSKAQIMAGSVKLTVDSSDLIPESELPVQHQGSKEAAKQWSVSSQTLASSQMNLVGYTVDEAIPLVDRMIDAAVVHGYTRLTIVHGIGSGTLKRAIREHLGESAYVKNCIPGGRDGENDGITIVEL